MILLSDFESDCERDGGSELECYPVSGRYILDRFNFNVVNPYQNIVVSVVCLICYSLYYACGSVVTEVSFFILCAVVT